MRRTVLCILLLAGAAGCATQRKVENIRKEGTGNLISLPAKSQIPDIEVNIDSEDRDTLTVTGMNGETLLIMKAVKDEDGEMVAHDVIDAAVVSARFRNVAERHGKVFLEFLVTVPESMQDGKWQLRFNPDMFILEDSIRLEPVIITGSEYRKAQLRGYQQYQRFVDSIVSDSTKFINFRLLEIFIERNIPQIYQFRHDTTFVSDEAFASAYGVTEREAIDHYTNKFAKELNKRKEERREKVFARLVKVPIVSEGLRLDTVVRGDNGDFVYNYIQQINTRPRLRKAEIVLSGEIYEQDRKVYSVPRSEPLTFYISSLSSFVDGREKYKTKVIHRKVEENTACYIDFESGSSTVIEDMGKNREEIGRIKDNLASLLENKEFDLDSIVISANASPEGGITYNERLTGHRAESISDYFNVWMKTYLDSLDSEQGYFIDEDGRVSKGTERSPIRFASRSCGENWKMLDKLVQEDTVLNKGQKEEYFSLAGMEDADTREKLMQVMNGYRYMRESLYPKLRTVKFDFHLHRKGMVRDTVHTTELDTTYMNGVQAIRDRDYEKAVTILRPYKDYNTAIAYLSLDYNASAMEILRTLERTAQVNYMLAVLFSRKGDDANAVQHYLHSCEQDPSFVHRGNLDPEISDLIKKYNLNTNL